MQRSKDSTNAHADGRRLNRREVGERLRAAREAFGWTLQEVAKASGISLATISRAERGKLALSYEKFSELSRTLKLDLAELFGNSEPARPLDGPTVTRAGEGGAYKGHSVTYRFLTTQALGKQMTPLIGRVHARKIRGAEDYVHHPGEEFVYVLRGTVQVHFENGKTLRLARGDALYFDSRMGHAYVSVGRHAAELIGVCTGESSMMISARAKFSAGRKSACRSP